MRTNHKFEVAPSQCTGFLFSVEGEQELLPGAREKGVKEGGPLGHPIPWGRGRQARGTEEGGQYVGSVKEEGGGGRKAGGEEGGGQEGRHRAGRVFRCRGQEEEEGVVPEAGGPQAGDQQLHATLQGARLSSRQVQVEEEGRAALGLPSSYGQDGLEGGGRAEHLVTQVGEVMAQEGGTGEGGAGEGGGVVREQA